MTTAQILRRLAELRPRLHNRSPKPMARFRTSTAQVETNALIRSMSAKAVRVAGVRR